MVVWCGRVEGTVQVCVVGGQMGGCCSAAGKERRRRNHCWLLFCILVGFFFSKRLWCFLVRISCFVVGFSILHSPFSILHSPFSILHSPFSILHSPFSILHSSFFILHSSFFILHFISFRCRAHARAERASTVRHNTHVAQPSLLKNVCKDTLCALPPPLLSTGFLSAFRRHARVTTFLFLCVYVVVSWSLSRRSVGASVRFLAGALGTGSFRRGLG